MSESVSKLAAQLAEDVLNAQEVLGEDRFYIEVGNFLGASSQTLEEAFLTEVRIRLSERAARQYINDKLKRFEADLKAQQGD